jgi:hypothetical protein
VALDSSRAGQLIDRQDQIDQPPFGQAGAAGLVTDETPHGGQVMALEGQHRSVGWRWG